MTADEVREALEEEIGSPFADATWNRLCRNYLRDFLEDQRSETWHTLREVAEDLSEYEQELKQEWASGDGVEPGTKKRRLPQKKSRKNQEAVEEHWFPELSREEMLRTEVYGEYLAKAAAADFYVARYRRRVLGERTATLTPYQAHSLIRSPAAQALPANLFRGMRITVGDHDAAFLEHESGLDKEEESVGEYTIIRGRWSENPEGIEWRVQSAVTEGEESAVTEGEDLAWLEFRNEQDEDDYMAVRQDSVLGELQRLASSLSERFPWGEAQATWFVLTGEPPLVPPVKVRYTSRPAQVDLEPSGKPEHFEYGEVAISAVPWVSERIVAEAYFNLQQRILPGDENRPLGRRRLELLRFVIQRENPVELTQTRRGRIGKKLVETWDRKNPNWAYGQYKQPTSAFWDAFNDVEELVLHPSWTHPRKVSQSGEAESPGE